MFSLRDYRNRLASEHFFSRMALKSLLLLPTRRGWAAYRFAWQQIAHRHIKPYPRSAAQRGSAPRDL